MTVTCKLVGGLGNCLFILATTIAYALKHGCDYCIPTHIDAPHEPEQKVFYSDRLKYCDDKSQIQKGDIVEYVPAQIYTEPFFQYQEIPKVSAFALSLHGYFQSYKYFNDYREQILSLLNIPKANYTNKIFLHYRLGDYKVLGKFHKIITQEYIADALFKFFVEGQTDVIVFSDEIEIAKQKINSSIWPQFNFEYSEGKTEMQDLSLMASCAGGIMSASAFSWWGAYAGNQDRFILYPSEWFGSEYKLTHSIKDLCPPNWQAI